MAELGTRLDLFLNWWRGWGIVAGTCAFLATNIIYQKESKNWAWSKWWVNLPYMPKTFFNLLIYSNTLFEMSSADLESTASCHHFGILRKLRLPWTTKGRRVEWWKSNRSRSAVPSSAWLMWWSFPKGMWGQTTKVFSHSQWGPAPCGEHLQWGIFMSFGLATWVKGEREACVISLLLCLSEEVCVVLWAESLAQVGTVEWVLPAGWRGTPPEGRCSGPHQWL